MKISSSFLLICLLLLGAVSSYAQDLSGLRSKSFALGADSILLDSLSIIPGSEVVRIGNHLADSTEYRINAAHSVIYLLKKPTNQSDSLQIVYRVFPMALTADHFLRDRKRMNAVDKNGNVTTIYTEAIERPNSIFGLEGLTKSGSISRGITIGNNQDAVLNSSLNLQLAGKIAGNIDVLAAITDDNIPIQAEGNTQQLQEFDKVFIQLSNPSNKLIAGDFEIKNNDGYFMRYYKKGQGGWYSFNNVVQRKGEKIGALSGGVSASVSKGKFARNTIAGIESNQGPYRLRGAENESFIVILSGSERIYLDGVLLDRGQDRDYVIDYNTAELTFTTKRIITKDSRILAEFQYSDKNYARTMLTANTEWKTKRFSAGVRYFSEQDSKNQPLQQSLSDADKKLLASVGDNTALAVAPNIDSVAFNVNEILYARRDTTIAGTTYTPVYVYSTSSDSAHFRVGFTNVGQGNGNYIAVDGLANGRVYKWVAPINGVAQGVYEPVIQLIAPKQRRMLTAGMNYSISNHTQISLELAGSQDDVNRFSTLDKANDNGGAMKIAFSHTQALSADTSKGWLLGTNVQSEVSDRHFKPIENYRPVEFTRDWNTGNITSLDDEVFTNVGLNLTKPGKAVMSYMLRSYERSTNYHGLMNSFSGNWTPGLFMATAEGSLLKSDGTQFKSTYLRHREELKMIKGKWLPGVRYMQEKNEITSIGTDTLSAASFGNRTAEAFIQRGDSTHIPLLITGSRREDNTPVGNGFRLLTHADMLTGRTGFYKGLHRIDVQANYRHLVADDTIRSSNPTEESASGRVEFNGSTLKGGVQVNTFYEAGTGREPRKRISYIAVTPGTGTYTWKDYNGDGIPQLNEFEVATFSDEAGYIRVLTPTDEYEKVYFNQWNATVNLNPAVFYKGGVKRPFWSRFALLTSVSFNNRVSADGSESRFNPLPGSINDSALLSTQSSGRHVLYYNRGQADFSADLTRQDQQARQLLSNGIEGRKAGSWGLVLRWGIKNWLSLQSSGEYGTKESHSEAYQLRDFVIDRWNVIQKVSIQPGSTYRFTLSFRNEEKKNVLSGAGGEHASLQDAGIEWRLSAVRKGIMSAKFNLVNIAYSGESNTSIAYEMLESLRNGLNLTWGCSMQRNLGSGLQLSLLYEGRKPTGIKAIHTGSVQVRAYF